MTMSVQRLRASLHGRPHLALRDHAHALQVHLRQCHAARPTGFTLRVGAAAARRFMSQHIFTTLLLALVLIGSGAHWV